MRLLTTLLTAIAVAAMTAACAGDGEEERFTLDMEQISILVGDDHRVTPSGAFTARSSNEAVATVNAEGIVHGVSAGEADIIFTSKENGIQQSCKAIVDWKYKFFDEPVLDFNATVEEIKQRETHELTWELDNSTEYLLMYDYANTGIASLSARYKFRDKNNFGPSVIVLEPSYSDMEIQNKIVLQLTERYGNPEVTEIIPGEYSKNYYKFAPPNKDFYIRYRSFDILYWPIENAD